MPEITITIHVPEGVTVAVGGQRTAPSAGAYVPTATGGDRCPEHGLPWKHVPPGVSRKTGKSYRAFWACPEIGCEHRPAIGWKPPVAAVPADVSPGDDFDWDADLA
jgi:hypothetical protein